MICHDIREVGADVDLNNLETTMNVSPIPTTRIHNDHPEDQIIGNINSTTQTRRMTKIFEEHAMKVIQALTDPSWIEAMQEELLQFKLQKVWICQILQEISQKRTRERMSDQEAKEIKAEAREIMPQPSTVNCS
ncbi:hypothetical protein Tco_0038406 [Tanacetum coccineum]